jgi:hypothetical protein
MDRMALLVLGEASRAKFVLDAAIVDLGYWPICEQVGFLFLFFSEFWSDAFLFRCAFTSLDTSEQKGLRVSRVMPRTSVVSCTSSRRAQG